MDTMFITHFVPLSFGATLFSNKKWGGGGAAMDESDVVATTSMAMQRVRIKVLAI